MLCWRGKRSSGESERERGVGWGWGGGEQGRETKTPRPKRLGWRDREDAIELIDSIPLPRTPPSPLRGFKEGARGFKEGGCLFHGVSPR